jgi:predicted ATPase/signal transduction histidine kinase
MTSIASTNLPQIPGYSIIEQLYNGSRTAVYRARKANQQDPVVIKVLQREYPNFSELVQFRNQYTIAKNLATSGIVHPLSLEPWRNSFALVMEDVAGLSLKQYAQDKSLDWLEVLVIARQLADILHDLTQHRVLHKDIKPANILICPQSKHIKLIDFSIASLLPKETQELKNPNVLEGTLAYLAPEQTGRMNRGIDYRTDFYSLGVTLYELLTGQLPFPCNDPLELVHCHIAKLPIPPHQINLEIPAIVSEIVLKLMAKNAEDRYQSALGLKSDLEKCLSQGKETGTIAAFQLAQRDVSDCFLIPEKLYGREAEVQQLLAAFERVAKANTEFMLVAGFSGIGKTAVVNEVHKPIVKQRGYFIKGKFDQFNRNIPFSALLQALRDLMGQLLSESDNQLQQWKNKILDAVGENGQVIIEVIPELEKIIGQQPPVAELSGSAAQNRFNLLFNKFIQVFTTKEHPLVIFLDDLQWADSASLNLMKLLMSEASNSYLLMMGAYRDNEVFPAHPLMLTLDEMRKADATINTITLAPLSEKNISHLVADTLSCDREVAKPLTELVYQKTKGNPFFTTQFLLGLYGEELIKFNRVLGHWECDIVQVKQRALTDDVVEFMAGRLQKLPEETQIVLKLAACIGNQFNLHTLAIVSEQSQGETATALWKALQEGFILPQNEVYKFYVGQEKQGNQEQSSQVVNYKFLHDRVQQAAYSLIGDDQKQPTHLKIGQLLLKNSLESDCEEKLFDIVNHLNMGHPLIASPVQRSELAQLNLTAGRKAKSATAYSSAITYLTTGIELLEDDHWQSQYTLTLALHEATAEAIYLNGAFAKLDAIANVTLDSAKTLLDKITIYEIQIQAYLAQNQLKEAITTGLSVLKQLGINLPQKPNDLQILLGLAKTKLILRRRKPQDLVNLPTMTRPEKQAAMRILSSMISASFNASPKLLPLVVFKQVDLSVRYGNTPLSAFAYAWYGSILCGVFIDIDAGYEFGQLAMQVLEKFHAQNLRCRTGFTVNSFINPWKQDLTLTLPGLLEAYQSGVETGDLEYAAWSALFQGMHLYWGGDELSNLSSLLQQYNEAISQWKQNNALVYNQTYYQSVLNLAGKFPQPSVLNGSYYSETEHLPVQFATGDRTGLFILYLQQLQLRYTFDLSTDAVEAANYARQYEDAGTATFLNVPLYLYDSLARLAVYSTATWTERLPLLRTVKKNQKKLKKWAHFAPMNSSHKWHLVEAEKCRVLGQPMKAIDHYDRAIAGAKENKYIQDEALANELAAKFYLNWGKEKVAAAYMQEAYYCYVRWGAKAKTNDLEKRYPNLLQSILQQAAQTLDPLQTLCTLTQSHLSINNSTINSHTSSNNINSTLDFAAVLKASQALSGTIQLDELLCQLTQIILQNSGGDRCALILPNSTKEWYVKAIATPEETQLCSQPLEDNPNLPTQLIQYVKNTQEAVKVDQLNIDLPIIDEYLLEKQPQSVLCLPILNQGYLVGILYLENQLTSAAFTQERTLILNFLCTQAAISLENAHLYQQAQDYAQQLEQSQLQIVQNEKMASLGNLVAGVAHEINNPLGFLNGSIANIKENLQDILEHLELYQQQYPDPTEVIEENAEEIDLDFLCEDIPELLNSMQGATKRIKNISTSLRTFSRADTEYKVSANLHEGLDSTLMILKYRLKANENRPAIEVIKDYGELSEVKCFPGQLNQVFMNIIANAIDVFDEAAQDLSDSGLEEKSQIITIKTTQITEQNAVEILICDNGKGMTPEVKERIFDHLFTTKGVGKGTGLGLAIARQIVVDNHGGSLDVESSVGQGTQFYIRLPN